MQDARGQSGHVTAQQPSPHAPNMQVAPPPAARPPSAPSAAAAAAVGASSSSSSSRSSSRVVGEYLVDHRIGAGSFASVWKAHHRKDASVLRAIKSVSKEKLSTNKKHEENLQQEIKIMQGIRHPNIVRLYDTRVRQHEQRDTPLAQALCSAARRCFHLSLRPLTAPTPTRMCSVVFPLLR